MIWQMLIVSCYFVKKIYRRNKLILAATITLWTIIVLSAIMVIGLMFGYNEELPVWARVLDILWNIWIIFMLLVTLGII